MTFSAEQRTIIETSMQTEGIPGVAAAIVKNGKMIAAEGFGYRHLAQKLPMTAHTVHPLCSVSKSFTAVSIMQLVEDGKLRLDEPVNSYLPDFCVADTEVSRRITPRMLLCHKSDIGRTNHQSFVLEGKECPYSSRADLVSQLATVHLQTPPTVAFSYSNEGYVTLSLLVETLVNDNLEACFERIFDTVGMTNTHTRFSQWREAPNRVYGYQEKGDTYEETHLPANYAVYLSTGGICSTAYDMARYLVATMDYGNNPLLSADSLDQMHSISMPHGDTGWGYGFGMEIGWHGSRKILFHGGGLPGITNHMLMIPAIQLGVVVLTNLTSAMPRQLAEKLAETMLNGSFYERVSDDKIFFRTRHRIPDAKILSQYVGMYKFQDQLVEVAMVGEQLTFSNHFDDKLGAPKIGMQALAIGDDLFMPMSVSMSSMPIRFVRGEDGLPQGFLRNGYQLRRC